MSIKSIFGKQDSSLFTSIETHRKPPKGVLPLTKEQLVKAPSGNVFGMTLNAGMGWEADKLDGDDVMILSTMGGKRGEDGHPIALGLHTSHFELGMQVKAAADEIMKI